MRFQLVAATLAVLLVCAAPASAATIFTFTLSDGTGADPGSIHAFSFDPLGAGGTLTIVKELDTFSPIVLTAVASGTLYPGAAFVAFDGVVSPATQLFRYDLTQVLFTSVQYSGLLETFAVVGETVTVTRGPAPAPEPATLWLLAVGAALMARRRATVRAPGRRLSVQMERRDSTRT